MESLIKTEKRNRNIFNRFLYDKFHQKYEKCFFFQHQTSHPFICIFDKMPIRSETVNVSIATIAVAIAAAAPITCCGCT